MTFLIADGVVPSNEDRGYVLRRIMRRAIQQGRALGLEPGFLSRLRRSRHRADGSRVPRAAPATRLDSEVARVRGGELRPHARAGAQAARRADRARASTGAEGIAAADAFLLHDTYGFPIDLTLEIVAEHGLGVDEEGFEVLMDEQRERARAGAGRSAAAMSCASARPSSPPTRASPPSSSATRPPTPRRRSARWSRRRAAAGQARRVAVLRHRRRPGRRRRHVECGTAAAGPGSRTSCGSATTRCSRSSPSTARSSPASASTPTSTVPPATPPSATTPPPTCCTPRCAGGWAATCARPAPTSGPTSCASTSPTARR